MEIFLIIMLILIAVELYLILDKLFSTKHLLEIIYQGFFWKDKNNSIGHGAYFALMDRQIDILVEIKNDLKDRK